ncbi:hypothetical protein JOM56_012029 [Amanita muscaria]
MAIDYATDGGIQSVPAAVVFALLYVPLVVWYLRTLIFISLIFIISLVRVVSFIIRALLAGSSSAAQNLSLYTADQRSLGGNNSQQLDGPLNIVWALVQNRHLFRLTMVLAVILGIVGASSSEDSQSSSTLRKASVIIFLVLTLLHTLNTALLINLEFVDFAIDPGIKYPSYATFGARNGSIVLLVISFLFLTREIFITGTLGNTAVYENEHFWYPFTHLTYLLLL